MRAGQGARVLACAAAAAALAAAAQLLRACCEVDVAANVGAHGASS